MELGQGERVEALMDDGSYEPAEVLETRHWNRPPGWLLLRLIRDGVTWWAAPDEWRLTV